MKRTSVRYAITCGIVGAVNLIAFNTFFTQVPPYLAALCCGISLVLAWFCKDLMGALPRAFRETRNEMLFFPHLVTWVHQEIADFQSRDRLVRWQYGARLAMAVAFVNALAMTFYLSSMDLMKYGFTKPELAFLAFGYILIPYGYTLCLLSISIFSEGRSDEKRIGYAQKGMLLSIPVVGSIFFLIDLATRIIRNAPKAVMAILDLVVDVVRAVPTLLFHLLRIIHTHMLVVCVIDGISMYLVSQYLFIEKLGLTPLSYSIGAFMVGAAIGYVHYEIVSVRVLHLSPTKTI